MSRPLQIALLVVGAMLVGTLAPLLNVSDRAVVGVAFAISLLALAAAAPSRFGKRAARRGRRPVARR